MHKDPKQTLTANQKKKLRQKRSKLGRRKDSTQGHSESVNLCNGSSSVNDSSWQPLQQSSLSAADNSTQLFLGSVTPAMSITSSPADNSGSTCQHISSTNKAGSCTEGNDMRLPQASSVPTTGQPLAGGRADMTMALLVMQSAAVAQQQQQRSRTISAHGNYKNYYGYRGDTESDPRLQAMERCWFANKRCIDIGCNAGLVSLAVATRFGTSAMLGMDIDAALIRTASTNLARRRMEVAAQLAAARQEKNPGGVRVGSASLRSLKGVWFQQGDIAANSCPVRPGSCDVAMALSVTKWIHINGGDEGLRRFFAAVHAALVPGGLLVLEPQPWRSYKQAVRKQDLVAGLQSAALASLQLRPDDFVDLLQSEGRFRFVRQLLEPGGVNRGFASRPMFLLERI